MGMLFPHCWFMAETKIVAGEATCENSATGGQHDNTFKESI
ncbi:Uncharacterized protein dnm_020400 [Desulfonema magnum]|uniref:Uncharacterized protein n=1 Tax=Desulfonema magnum TaxID=45655 RepID=A0A975GLQ7_9BACT|nr:Uncharacterized protein dnm_020400 [Desulfonema magnum]